jgi:chondroitin 4-sulfotransferase 11
VQRDNFHQGGAAAQVNPFKILSYCDLSAVLRILGWREAVKLFKFGAPGPDEYSLKPFVRTDSIFVHIPKTGGVSINRALYGSLGMGHMSLGEYRKLFRSRAFRRMFKFTFVRNPFDRIHSAYHFLRAGGMGEIDADFDRRVLKNFPSFEHFVLEGFENAEVSSFWHFLPQTDLLACEDHGLHDLDFVGRYETLAEDFEVVRSRVNPAAQLPHLNRTPSKDDDYRRVYTPEMIDCVARRYAAALDLFGYEFDGVERPTKLTEAHSSRADRTGRLFADAFQLRKSPLSGDHD